MLTALQIKNAKYNPAGTGNKLSDGKGLYLLLKANGSKYWRMNYRAPITGKQKTIAIGVYPQVTLEQARTKCNEYKAILNDGLDPLEERKKAKEQARNEIIYTFAYVADKWLYTRELENKVNSEVIRLLNKDILPHIGNMPISKIGMVELENLFNILIERKVLETARRTKNIINGVMKRALKDGLIERNYTDLITLPHRDKKAINHHSAITNEKDLKPLLVDIWAYREKFRRGTELTEIAMKLGAYIFQRPNEIRYLKWENINWSKQQIEIIASKTSQPHIIPISNQVYDLLRRAEKIKSDDIYIFPTKRYSTSEPVISENTVNKALEQLGYRGKQTFHGFRATARTLLDEELGERVEVIEMQLAHTVKDHNGTAYNRTQFLQQRIELMQKWADYLDTIRQGKNTDRFKNK